MAAVFKFCCFTSIYFHIRFNLHQWFYCLSLPHSFVFWETSGIKAKCFNKQEKRRLVSLYQINREQNWLTKLHLSRNDIRKSLYKYKKKKQTKKEEWSLQSHCIRAEVNQFAQWFMATNHEARWYPCSKKINFSWKWWHWRILSVGKFSIPHAFCFNLCIREWQTQLLWDFFKKCCAFSPPWSPAIGSEDVLYHAGRRIQDNWSVFN